MESAGHYPIERRAGEIDRLHLQGDAVAFDAAVMLDRIGVGPGWRCLPSTIEAVRGTLLDKGLIAADELDAALAACRAHLAHPDTVFTTVTVAQVWGTRPGGAARG